MEELCGKVVLVTGGSRGIGSAIAKELARNGAIIAINFSKDVDGATKTMETIERFGGYCKLFKRDISEASECKELIEEVITSFGKLDILVNNAAKSKIGLFMDLTVEEIQQLVNTNLLSTIYLCKYAVQHMSGRGSGNIINISSMWGEVGASCEVLYSTTKGGINLLTKSLAKEVASFGIRVNAVAPGVINTDMNKFLSDEEKKLLKLEIPMGRYGEVEEVAKIVAFLSNDDCRYLTGQIIRVDGAMI